MKKHRIAPLEPVATTVDPSYPPRSSLASSWRCLAIAVGAAGAMLLGACGDDKDDPPRLAGDVQPIHEVRPAGTPVPPQLDPPDYEEPKKPDFEEPVPEPVPRTAGVPMPTTL